MKSNHDIFDYSTVFRLGHQSVSIKSVLGENFYRKMKLKFDHTNQESFDLAVREAIRYVYLSAYSEEPLFFTGSKLVDDIWHSFIIETEFYSEFCDKLRSGSFVEHSGITYEDYSEMKTTSELYEEQFSWLASYIGAFGQIEEKSINHIPLATALMNNMRIDLNGLNLVGYDLLNKARGATSLETFDFEKTLLKIQKSAGVLDEDAQEVKRAIFEIIAGFYGKLKKDVSNANLFEIYSRSTALGFTIWQHLAAVERLNDSNSWKEKNNQILMSILNGEILVGLGTTHLARATGSTLRGISEEQNFKVNGTVPWCTGYSIFSKIIIGFETESEVIFALTEFPSPLNPIEALHVTKMELTVLNSTSTVSMRVKNLLITDQNIISRRSKTQLSTPLRTQYRMPDLGMAKGALGLIENHISETENPRNQIVINCLPELKKRFDALKIKILDCSIEMTDELQCEKADIIRDTVRLFGLIVGGSSLKVASEVSRRNLETLLLDIVVQSPTAFEIKIKKTCMG